MRFALPLVVLVIVAAFLYRGLSNDPRYVPSPLIGKAAPEFSLPVLADGGEEFSTSQMKGKVWLLNIWGTWWVGCLSLIHI